MKTFTIGQRIAAGFAAVIVVTLLLGAFAFGSFYRVDQARTFLTRDAIPGTISVMTIQHLMERNLSLVLTHINSDDKAAVAREIEQNVKAIDTAIQAYESSITTTDDRELFAEFVNARTAFVREFKNVLALSADGRTAEAMAAVHQRLEPAVQARDRAINRVAQHDEEDLRSATTNIDKATHDGFAAIGVGLAAAVIASAAIAWFIQWSIIRALTETGDFLASSSQQTAAAAGQVSGSSQSLAGGASEQAASLEETSASLEELSSMTKRNADSAGQARQTADRTRQTADAGAQRMQQMQDAMESIRHSSEDIRKILKTIDEIAFQTNILALNAAVEAARAGEAGAGFAVVADEVRSLAQRAALAAKETAEKIESAAGRTKQGVEISADVARSFTEIQSQVRDLDQLVDEIATASNEQSQGIAQVTAAVTEMDKVTQANAATAEETAAAAEELSTQSAALQDAVNRLQVLTGAAKHGRIAKRAAASGSDTLLRPRIARTNGATRREAAAALVPADS